MDKNILSEISQDKEFIQKLLSQDTDQGFKDVLEEKGINISLEDAKEIREQILSALNGEVTLTDEELEIINGGGKGDKSGTTVGDAIKYTVKTALGLTLLAVIGKVGYDVYDDVSSRKTFRGVARTVGNGLGFGNAYERGIHKIGDAIIDVTGGKKEDSSHTEDIKPLIGQKKESEEIVKGFGLKNGKLF